MSIAQLIILAVIQGITEWLPISSSGHVLLFSNFVGIEGRDELLINAMSNLGTLLALLIYFHRDVLNATLGGFSLLAAPLRKTPLSDGAKLAMHIIAATIAALAGLAVFGLLVPEDISNAIRGIYTVAAMTIVFGVLLWWADGREETRETRDMTLLHSAIIGASQAAAALLPGTSRSGITMTFARMLGYQREDAARFSMLIGAPLVAAAGLYGALGLLDGSAASPSAISFADGLVVAGFAFLSGIASIWALMTLLKRMSFLPFVIYRLVLGAALLLASPLALDLIAA